MNLTETIYPFAAIVGQERLKKALILCAIQPRISGLLIRGEKGTAKSTTVRALAALLPEIPTIAGCSFGCDPNHPEKFCYQCRMKWSPIIIHRPVRVITLPLNATEDRVTGGIDFDQTVKTGKRTFQPGLLAAAHRGILYVDEVNLLDDHLADIILDAAASGINRVEREGISFVHPAQFVLVGTMNPEEGELRPQFLDRFGMCVEVSGEKDPELRQILMERREAFDLNPSAFFQTWRLANQELASKIVYARHLVSKIVVGFEAREQIAEICRRASVAGHRADLMMELAASAICAWDGRVTLSGSDLQEAASFVLPHRKRDFRQPHQITPQEKHTENTGPESPDSPLPEKFSPELQQSHTRSERSECQHDSVKDRIFAIGQTFSVKRMDTPKDRFSRRGSGRRSRTRSAQKTGRYVRSIMSHDFSDMALDATLRAAAPCQKQREGKSGLKVTILKQDVRKKIREKRMGNYIVFVVDASGSMGARKRMIATKGAIMSLLLDAYRMRDRIAMVTFRKTGAELLLPPTNSIVTAARMLSELPVGGKTPLSAGLTEGYKVANIRLHKDPLARPILIFITDGRSNMAIDKNMNPIAETMSVAAKMAKDHRMTYIVVDTEPEGHIQFNLAARLAHALSARHFKIENLRSDDLVRVVRETQHA